MNNITLYDFANRLRLCLYCDHFESLSLLDLDHFGDYCAYECAIISVLLSYYAICFCPNVL